jgi:hypothetical protein
MIFWRKKNKRKITQRTQKSNKAKAKKRNEQPPKKLFTSLPQLD